MRFWHHSGGGPPSESVEALPPPAGPTSQELRYLSPSSVRFRSHEGRLQLLEEGEEDWKEVHLARLFPLSEPESWLSVLDKEGKEVGILSDLRGLAQESLSSIREELGRRYLIPSIRRILACRDRFDMVEWTVETDRGKTTFLTRNLRDQAQQPLPGRFALTDVEGNRYDIPDLSLLDPASRRWLEERL